MASAKLKFNEQEITIGEDAMSFGRTTDNMVSFPDNSNISRRHAEIKFADGQFVLSDLGSSNGTTVNGQRVEGDFPLQDGDFITLGNSVIVEFMLEDAGDENADGSSAAANSQSLTEAKTADETKKSSRLPVVMGITGALCGLAVIFAVVAVYVSVAGVDTPDCAATARFTNLGNGQVVSEQTEVRIELTNAACVSAVHVILNGNRIATLTEEPYTVQLDPNNYPNLADGSLYPLKIVLEDAEGNPIPQQRDIALQFETKEIEPPPTVTPVAVTPTPKPTPGGKQPSVIETEKMVTAVVGKFTGGSFKYNLSNADFLREVNKKTAEYATPGYFGKAAAFQEKINLAFVRERNLDPSLGYVLALSRSKFNPAQQNGGEGLWQMSNDFATANAYNAVCGGQTLSESTQDCAAKVTALYMEDLVMKAFDGDIIYGVAAFGKTTQEALVWKSSLPADRSNFWNAISDAAQREQVVRFFAAAVVAENPGRFGLKTDRPISELYPPRTN